MPFPQISFKSNDGVKTVLFFLFSFFMSMLLLVPFASVHYENVTLNAVHTVEVKLDAIKSDFQKFITQDSSEKGCPLMVQELRQSVFGTHMVKEAALFDSSGLFYCSTTDGSVSFQLFESIERRLEATNTTLSYSRAAVTGLKSIMLIFTNGKNGGVSLLIPPKYIYDVVQSELGKDDIHTKVEVIGRDINPSVSSRYLSHKRFKSNKYPLSVTSYIDGSYYFQYMLNYMWFGFLIAGVSTVAIVFQQHKRLVQRSLGFSLNNALDQGHLHVHYQPIVDQRSKEVVGCESLLRWNDPIEGAVSPAIFIPLAENLDLIEDLTYFVLSEALTLIDKNPKLFETRYVSVNISRKVASNAQFFDKVTSIFEGKTEELQKIVFEITENGECSGENMQQILLNLQKFSALGVKIAVDDFGTGYAGLDFVRQFPFSVLKIDRVFVKNITDESSIGLPLLESMIQLSKSLDMKLIVEGVENELQLSVLSKMGVKYIQGFYFHKPMPRSEFIHLLKKNVGQPQTASEHQPACEPEYLGNIQSL